MYLRDVFYFFYGALRCLLRKRIVVLKKTHTRARYFKLHRLELIYFPLKGTSFCIHQFPGGPSRKLILSHFFAYYADYCSVRSLYLCPPFTANRKCMLAFLCSFLSLYPTQWLVIYVSNYPNFSHKTKHKQTNYLPIEEQLCTRLFPSTNPRTEPD